jgi:hypothetical protein
MITFEIQYIKQDGVEHAYLLGHRIVKRDQQQPLSAALFSVLCQELERIGLNLSRQKIWALAEQLEEKSTASLSLESQK